MARKIVSEFADNSLGLFASAIAFQVLTALVPLALLAVGLAGFLSLGETWSREVAPQLREQVSAPAFALIDSTIKEALDQKRLLWVTAGALIAVWQLSGAVRAGMSALDRIYGARSERGFWPRMGRSAWLAAAIAAVLCAAAFVVVGAPRLYGEPGAIASVALFVLRWAAAIGLLLLAVGLMVHFGPSEPQDDVAWTSRGSLLVVGLWALTSIGFGLYLSVLADSSLFGHLVTVVVLIGYLYGAALAFLIGAQTDAVLRDREDGAPARPRPGTSAPSKPRARPFART